jgi:hypothetical protein
MDQSYLVDLLTPGELASLANEHTVIAITNFALYLSILSGYLVAAFLAGGKLRKSQIALINSIFSISAGYFALTYFANIILSTVYSLELPRVEVTQTGTKIFMGLAVVVFLAMAIAIPFSIRFLSEVRENASESGT